MGTAAPQGLVLELTHALAGATEFAAQLLERLRVLAVEAVAALEDVAHARLERVQGGFELAGAVALGGDNVRCVGVLVLDQVGDEALAVAHGRLE